MQSELCVHAETRDEAFVSDLSQALLKKNVKVLEFVHPTSRRVDGRQVTYKPKTDVEFDSLHHLSKDTLRKIGCKLWDDFGGVRHWLLPVDWYDSIPHGRVIVFTDGHKELFVRGETTRSRELGALCFGFIQVVE
jgi:hypothetical protein